MNYLSSILMRRYIFLTYNLFIGSNRTNHRIKTFTECCLIFEMASVAKPSLQSHCVDDKQKVQRLIQKLRELWHFIACNSIATYKKKEINEQITSSARGRPHAQALELNLFHKFWEPFNGRPFKLQTAFYTWKAHYIKGCDLDQR